MNFLIWKWVSDTMIKAKNIIIQHTYEDQLGLKITIQANKEGYSIIYADYTMDNGGSKSTARTNFINAYKKATQNLGKLKRIS